jgi:hypothetical protein
VSVPQTSGAEVGQAALVVRCALRKLVAEQMTCVLLSVETNAPAWLLVLDDFRAAA